VQIVNQLPSTGPLYLSSARCIAVRPGGNDSCAVTFAPHSGYVGLASTTCSGTTFMPLNSSCTMTFEVSDDYQTMKRIKGGKSNHFQGDRPADQPRHSRVTTEARNGLREQLAEQVRGGRGPAVT